MTQIDRALLSKEWTEHRLKVLALSSILLLVSVAAVPFGVSSVLDLFYLFIALYYPALGGIFIAMRVAAGERTDGTLLFVTALPIPPRRYAFFRLLGGAVACCLPIVLASLFAVLCAQVDPSFPSDGRARGVMKGVMAALDTSPAGATAVVGLVATLSTLTVFLWACLSGVGAASEIAAGVRAVAVLFLAFVVLILTYAGTDQPVWNTPGPAGWLAILELLTERRTGHIESIRFTRDACLVQLAVMSVLAFFWLWRYSRLLVAAGSTRLTPALPVPDRGRGSWANRLLRADRSAVTGSRSVQVPAEPRLRPRRSTSTALMWKQVRELVPTGLVALLLFAGLLVFSMLVAAGGSWLRVLAEGFLMLGWAMGLLMGTAAFLSNVDPKLADFWRSRPVRTSSCFWVQYLSALIVFLAFVVLPFLLMVLIEGPSTQLAGRSHSAAALQYLSSVVVMHVLTFSIAVALICLVRRLVYAGFLSGILSMAIILYPTTLAPDLHDLWDVAMLTPLQNPYWVFLKLSFASTVAAIGVAWFSQLTVRSSGR